MQFHVFLFASTILVPNIRTLGEWVSWFEGTLEQWHATLSSKFDLANLNELLVDERERQRRGRD